jgi:hypothetical protein
MKGLTESSGTLDGEMQRGFGEDMAGMEDWMKNGEASLREGQEQLKSLLDARSRQF